MKKNIYKSILLLAGIAMMAIFASSCDKNNSDNGGVPYISYVRIADPASADSLLVAASQGQLIAIIGGNLQHTQQVWFNDQQAKLAATYISNTCVFANVPTQIPMDITNKMKLIFSGGDSLLYDFTVTISKPQIKGADKTSPYGMDCEYVADGDYATVYGQYFYLPLTVTFAGGQTASSENGDVTVNDANTALVVKVPEGAQPGQITVTSNFGSTKSDFWFRDNRNIFQGFEDDATNTSNPDSPFGELGTNVSPGIVTSAGEGDPPLINNNYIRAVFNAQTWWMQLFCNWNIGLSIPDDAILHPSDYYYKFEVCTTKPYNASGIHIWITDMTARNNTPYYQWSPSSFDTKGVWQTVIIPLEDIAAAEVDATTGIKYFPSAPLPDGYFCGVVYAGADVLDCDMSFDNFRIVPKVIR